MSLLLKSLTKVTFCTRDTYEMVKTEDYIADFS